MADGRHARIYNRIWRDPDWLALTSGAQRLYMLALSQDSLTMCGVTLYSERRWAKLAKNTSPGTIAKDCEELAGARFVVVDDDTEELCIRSYLRWDGVLSSPNLVTRMAKDFDTVASGRIRDHIVEQVKREHPEGFRAHLERFPKGFPKGFPEGFLEGLGEGLSQPFGEVAPARIHPHPHPPPPLPQAPTPAPFREGSPDTGADDGDEVGVGGAGLRPEDGAKPGQQQDASLALTHRITEMCTGTSRGHVRLEAAQVAVWALAHVDPRIVEEVLGWCEQAKQPPVLPRAVASAISRRAADHGISMPAFLGGAA